jgi:hypothetical protein
LAVERKYERDVDILLAEEFATNPEFSIRIKALTKFATLSASVKDFWVSKSNTLGESDLIILYESDVRSRFALLIEDKVDAPLQPEQAARYRLRADRERTAGVYDDYEVLLCAPEHSINNRQDLSDFDRTISFETIAEIIRCSSNDRRALYRVEFLETAGTKRVNKWVREDDPLTNAFWQAAYQMATRDFPQLEMKPLSLTKDSSWINFRPRDFPTTPKRIYISFKGDRGHMDLTFSNTTAHVFSESVSRLLAPDMTIHQTAASAAVRIQSPGFRISDGVEIGMPRVRAAFAASVRLIDFYREKRAELEKAARIATPD